MARRVSFAVGFLALTACAPACADVVISDHGTAHMSCSAGVCTPTAAKAFLNVDDLQSMLASSNVTVESTATAPDIHVASALSWASSSTLFLDSYRSIAIKAPISVTGTGGLTIRTDEEGVGSDYAFTGNGRAIFWDTSSSLTINARSYTLVADIASLASGYAATPAADFALAGDYDAAPDGTYAQAPIATTVMGIFEGLGNTISNLSIHYHGTTRQNIGLFAVVNGTIRDLNLRHAKVVARPRPDGAAQVGTLVGQFSSGTVLNDTAVGTVSVFPSPTAASGDAGGLVGVLSGGFIVDSNFDGTVSAGRAVAGGLVGQAMGSQITRSSSTASVYGTVEQGGLVGVATNSIFLLDHATGNVTGPGAFSGGLIGWTMGGSVTQSYATGSVVGGAGCYAGGLIGQSEKESHIVESYALGSVTALKNSNVGGLVGNNRFIHPPSISQAYSTGAVSASGGGLHLLVGGLLGFDRTMNVELAYWDLDTSGIGDPSQGAGSPANDPGITGLSDAALKSGLPAGFDPTVWGSDPSINDGLPYLLAQPPG